MLADIKAGKIKRVVVKDMSRLGRNYLQVGMYTEMVFPEYGVHFIAVNDGVDSIKGDSEFTAIRNVFNEMFAKDTSKKIKATWQSKGRSGEHLCTIPPYGYMKDPEDKKRWIVDEEAAAIVQKIFSLCVDGLGPTQIAKWLQHNNVLNPTAYAHEKGLPVCNAPTANPYKWTNETVSRILERIEYLGHTVNFKTSKPSFKSKKKVWNNPSEWVIFENTQEAIIEESVFLVVQNIRQARRRPTKMGDMGMFSGLVYCADCGGKMYLCRANHFKPEQEYYICSTYRKDRTLCKTHSIRRVVLEEIVLRNLREAISYVTQYEDDFIQRAAERSLRERDKALAQKDDLIQEHTPDIRSADLEKGIEVNNRMVELLAGLSQGILTPPTTSYATATEMRAALNNTFSVITKFRRQLEKGTNDLLTAVDAIANRNNLSPIGPWTVQYDWSSAYIEQMNEHFTQLTMAEGIGAVEKAEVRSWLLDEDYETAKARVAQIAEESGAEYMAEAAEPPA